MTTEEIPNWFMWFNVIVGIILIYGGSYYAFTTGDLMIASWIILCGTTMEFLIVLFSTNWWKNRRNRK